MDAIDASTSRPLGSANLLAPAPPSLLFIILDLQPYAWSYLSSSSQLDFHTAVAQLLVFINAHLAFSHENRVAVLGTCLGRVKWLYPSRGPRLGEIKGKRPRSDDSPDGSREGDAEGDEPGSLNKVGKNSKVRDQKLNVKANKYAPFAEVESSILSSLQDFLLSLNLSDLSPRGDSSADASSRQSVPGTPIAASLTLALNYINRQTLPQSGLQAPSNSYDASSHSSTSNNFAHSSRILIVSASGDQLAEQYIPLMNAMFAAQHSRIPIDILKVAGDSALLQQASYTTGGVFIRPDEMTGDSASSHGKEGGRVNLLPYLFYALLPDASARSHLLLPTSPHVDLRAACFCHRRVVSLGYVCSVCLSIFCSDSELPVDEENPTRRQCLTCGTFLAPGAANEKLALDADGGERKEKKDKKKKRDKDRERG